MNSKEKIGLVGAAGIFGILADWTTIASWLEEHLPRLGIAAKYAEYVKEFGYRGAWIVFIIVLCFFILYLVLYLCSKMINKHLSKIGTHGIPCSAYQYWAFRIKNNTGYLLSSLHRGLYHCTCGIKRNIKARRSLEPNHLHTLLDFAPDLTRLLQFFHSILYTAFHIDASISIYRISETSDERLVLTREIFLMSKTEESKANMRQQNHKYLIAREPANSIKELASKAQLYCEHHGNAMFQKNSAFDFLLSNPQNFWLSNDLSIDIDRGEFFTSSPNHKEFYKSLAAFAILPPECNKNKDASIKGILTFDTEKTNLFVEKECVALMGIMAHTVNEIIESLN